MRKGGGTPATDVIQSRGASTARHPCHCARWGEISQESFEERQGIEGLWYVMMDVNRLTEHIIGAAIEVHRALGPGLLESTYEECLCRELVLQSIPHERQRTIPIEYKGIRIERGYRLDLVVRDAVVVEIKAVSALESIHEAQLLTYLRLGGWQVGLLINFNVPVLTRGIKRMINTLR
jgi:GxxExxY protein